MRPAFVRAIRPNRAGKPLFVKWCTRFRLGAVLSRFFAMPTIVRTRKDYAPEALSLIRRLAHIIFRMHPSPKDSAAKCTPLIGAKNSSPVTDSPGLCRREYDLPSSSRIYLIEGLAYGHA